MSITCAVQFTLAKTLPMVALLNTLKASGLARRLAGLLRLAARQNMGSTEALTGQAALARCQRTLLRKHPALGGLFGQAPGSKGTHCNRAQPSLSRRHLPHFLNLSELAFTGRSAKDHKEVFPSAIANLSPQLPAGA